LIIYRCELHEFYPKFNDSHQSNLENNLIIFLEIMKKFTAQKTKNVKNRLHREYLKYENYSIFNILTNNKMNSTLNDMVRFSYNYEGNYLKHSVPS